MENLYPHSPLKSRILDLRERGNGGLLFHFILSKIVKMAWRKYFNYNFESQAKFDLSHMGKNELGTCHEQAGNRNEPVKHARIF